MALIQFLITAGEFAMHFKLRFTNVECSCTKLSWPALLSNRSAWPKQNAEGEIKCDQLSVVIR